MSHGTAGPGGDRYGIAVQFILMKSVNVSAEYLPDIFPARVEDRFKFIPFRIREVAPFNPGWGRDMHCKDNIFIDVFVQCFFQELDILAGKMAARIVEKDEQEVI